MNSNSNEIARFRKLHCCSELYCDTLLVYCTPRMTDLAAGRVYTATLCTQEEFILLHYAHACNTTLSA